MQHVTTADTWCITTVTLIVHKNRGLIHTLNFSTLRLCNSACACPITLKFGSRTALSLLL